MITRRSLQYSAHVLIIWHVISLVDPFSTKKFYLCWPEFFLQLRRNRFVPLRADLP